MMIVRFDVFYVTKIFYGCGLSVLVVSLTSCTTLHTIGPGSIVDIKKINSNKIKPGEHTINGALFGGKTGVVAGGTLGALIGIIPASLTLTLTADIILIPLFCAGVGAIIVGIAGATLVSTAGYAYDVFENNKFRYEYTVKPNNTNQLLTSLQYSNKFTINQQVQIFEKNGKIILKPM